MKITLFIRCASSCSNISFTIPYKYFVFRRSYTLLHRLNMREIIFILKIYVCKSSPYYSEGVEEFSNFITYLITKQNLSFWWVSDPDPITETSCFALT